MLTYLEADLPEMAERKRFHLKSVERATDDLRVVAVDALADTGPDSLAALAATLDARRGLAIITEGLLNYFDHDAVLGMWTRFARTLSGFAHGVYLSDLHLARDNRSFGAAGFSMALGAFTRGKVHLHFRNASEAQAALLGAGFASASLEHPPPQRVFGAQSDSRSARLVTVVEACSEPLAPPKRARKPRGGDSRRGDR
jgi:O-methyltransferase involved in polyketide biosynthesis